MSKEAQKIKEEKTAEERKITPDAEYLKSPELGLVIAKGMAVMYRTNPKNPVDFLAKWLLNHSQVQRAAESQKKIEKDVGKHKKAHVKKLAKLEDIAKQEQEVRDARQAKIDEFNATVEKQTDLCDTLQQLSEHLKDFTGATAVYIGKLVTPLNKVEDGDDENTHLNEAADKIVQFGQATPGHEFLIDQTMAQDQGLTFDVFKDPEVAEAEPEPEASQVDPESGVGSVKGDKPVVEKLPHCVVIKEVVREPRMHYFKVPRLGSYMAIRLEYDSCLNESAFDAGVAEMKNVQAKRRDQEEEKLEWEKNAAQAAEEKAQNEEASEYVPEDKEWPDIVPEPYQKTKIQYVVCLNSCGQDREFTEEQRKFALRAVQAYRDRWEKLEEENLTSDINSKIETFELDQVYKANHEALDNTELDAKCEQGIQAEEGEEPLNEDQKIMALKKQRFNLLTKTFYDPAGAAKHKRIVDKDKQRASQNFGSRRNSGSNKSDAKNSQNEREDEKYYPVCPEQWKDPVLALRSYNVIKCPRVLQTLCYMLGYTREEVCERDTNKLSFKKVRELLNDEAFFQKMQEYKFTGPKTQEFRAYEKLSFLKKNLEHYQEEDVEAYSMTVAKLYQWVALAIELRMENVVSRRDAIEEKRHERELATTQSNERQAKLDAALEEAQNAFEAKVQADLDAAAAAKDPEEEGAEPTEVADEDKPQFPLDDFMVDFNTNNPPIEIPDEVVEDIDNDYDLAYTAPTFE